MCRLYAFLATEPTKVECTLVHAQNALMSQSREDLKGLRHGHGWGVAVYNAAPHVDRQAWAAYHGEHFARAAARTYSRLTIAHIRRATVGEPALENTHPFVSGHWVFAHNGTVPGFDRVRPILLEMLVAERRAAIRGTTDSEYLFAYLLSLLDRGEVDVSTSLLPLIRRVAEDIQGLVTEEDKPLGLNLVLSDGSRMAGSRLNRSLFYTKRKGLYDCEICGFPHVHHNPKKSYRAIVIASEPLTHETWSEIVDKSVWEVDHAANLTIEPLGSFDERVAE